MLGTNDIPPPLRVPWQMWSQSSDPHQQGLVQFEFTEEGIGVNWFPDRVTTKDVIPWYELAWTAGSDHPDLVTECEFLKEKAEQEGYRLGLEKAVEMLTERVLKIKGEGSENPFLKKYGADLGKALKDIQQIVEELL